MLAAVLFAAALGSEAPAEAASEAPTRVAITIYRAGAPPEDPTESFDPETGLAMITETRVVDAPAGRSRISFRGVAETIVPQTAAVEGLPGEIVERNQDYDLLSPGALARASVGQSVKLVRTNRRTGEVTETPAVIRSDAGGVTLQTAEGIEALGCSGGPERLVFEAVPKGLAERPTLSVLTETPRAGRYTVRLSYLATGFTWKADYVAKVQPDGRTLSLIGWLTISNGTSTSFKETPAEVVAGRFSRDESTVPTIAPSTPMPRACWPRSIAGRRWEFQDRRESFQGAPVALASAGLEEIVVTAQKAHQSDLGDYKLYTLPEPTTVAARQTKQVLFLDERHVAFERVLSYRLEAEAGRFDPEDATDAAGVVLRLHNTGKGGLGKPLPSGTFSVMQTTADGREMLAGEHQAERDTPVGLPLDLEIGRDADVVVAPRVVSNARKDGERRYTVEVRVTNAGARKAMLEYRHAPDGEGFRVVEASRKAGTKAGDALWTLTLRPGSEETLRYTVRFDD